MVACLMTVIDLLTRCAGLSASAELLVSLKLIRMLKSIKDYRRKLHFQFIKFDLLSPVHSGQQRRRVVGFVATVQLSYINWASSPDGIEAIYNTRRTRGGGPSQTHRSSATCEPQQTRVELTFSRLTSILLTSRRSRRPRTTSRITA